MRSMLWGLLLVTLFSAGCTREPAREATPGPESGALPATTATAGAGRIKVEDASGQVLFELKPSSSGYKVHDASDRVLAKLKVESDRVKAEDDAGKPLLKFKKKERKCKIEDDAGKVVYEFEAASGGKGDYRLKDASGGVVYRIKSESYGYKVTDAADTTLFKMKVGDDRVVGDGPDGRKRLEIKGTRDALAASASALDRLDVPARAALLAYLLAFEGNRK